MIYKVKIQQNIKLEFQDEPNFDKFSSCEEEDEEYCEELSIESNKIETIELDEDQIILYDPNIKIKQEKHFQ